MSPMPTRPRAARVVGKHCESGDILVDDARLPPTCGSATCSQRRSPAPMAGRWPPTTTGSAAPLSCSSRGGDARVVVRRETVEDLLRLDRRPRAVPASPVGRPASCTLVHVEPARASDRVAASQSGVLGCGNVGAAFVALVDSGAGAISGRTGIDLEVTRIAVRDLGLERPGIDRIAFDKRATTDTHSIVTDPEVDIVVELMGGVEPARSLSLRRSPRRNPSSPATRSSSPRAPAS